MSQPVHLLGEPPGPQLLDDRHQARVEPAALAVQQRAVGDLVGEGVLERVLEVGEEARLVQELGGLQVGQRPAQRFLRDVLERLEEGEGHVLADDRGRLEQALLAVGQAIEARGENGLHRRRHLDARWRPRRAVLPPLALERAGLDQRPRALLQEEGVAVRALDQEALEGSQPGLDAEQRAEQLVRALARERVEDQTCVVALAAPAVLVLRPEVGQQDDPRARHALDEAVEQRLRLAVHPLEILEDQEQRLALALAQQERPDRVERTLAAQRGIEPLPPRVVGRDVEQGQQSGEVRLERRVERAQSGLNLGVDLACVIARLELEVALEQVRDRQVRRGLAVGYRPTFEDEPPRS